MIPGVLAVEELKMCIYCFSY